MTHLFIIMTTFYYIANTIFPAFSSDVSQSFHTMLHNISQQLSDLTVAALAYINNVHETGKGEAMSAVSLLQVLVRRGEFSPSNVQPLGRMLKEINRHDIIHEDVHKYELKVKRKKCSKCT